MIVPVYNRRGFLERCLASITATRYPDLEVLMIDDGSSDGSWEQIQHLASANPNTVKALHHPGHRNQGISASRNLGLRLCTGNYVAFLDSDDEYLPCRFDHCVDILEANPLLLAIYECVAIQSREPGATSQDQQTSRASGMQSIQPSPETLERVRGSSLQWLFLNDWWLSPGITIRKSFFQTHGDFREDLQVAEDTEMWMRLAGTERIQFSESQLPVATVCRHSSGHSWDGVEQGQRLRIYRKALLAAFHATRQRPDLYAPEAANAMATRYQQAVADDLGFLSRQGSHSLLLRLLAEAALNQPRALFTRRTLGDLARWKWR